LVLSACLVLLVIIPYAQTVTHEFISYDDQEFVTNNPVVRSGLSWDGLRWAFTTAHSANWIPLAWLSHMLDVSLFGLAPGWHHLVNVLLHALSTVLLFFALFRMTGGMWQSVFVAALFGIHPLHVESVAWIAERKDVLSGLFFMLILLAYERYVRLGGVKPYLLVLLLFALGLLSKSMLVTVPFVLLLLDIWPLGRTSLAAPATGLARTPPPWQQLVREKVPLFLLSLMVSIVTYVAQLHGGAMGAMEQALLPFVTRLANAAVAYASYLGKMIWPSSLAVFYPHPGLTLPWWKVIGAVTVLTVITASSLKTLRTRPYLSVGLAWFLGTLVPVIGLVQVGIQAEADRYMYLPLIGLAIMLAWSAEDLFTWAGKHRKQAQAAAGGVAIVVLVVLTTMQVVTWKDSISVFRRAVEVVPENWYAHRALAGALAQAGRPDDAIEQYQEALRLRPRDSKAHNDLAVELAGQHRYEEAIMHYREALRIRQDFPEAHNNLGNALAMVGRSKEAVEQYQRALELRPGWSVPMNSLRILTGRP
jgi:tetratricopeptide (TPR) repeat protein